MMSWDDKIPTGAGGVDDLFAANDGVRLGRQILMEILGKEELTELQRMNVAVNTVHAMLVLLMETVEEDDTTRHVNDQFMATFNREMEGKGHKLRLERRND